MTLKVFKAEFLTSAASPESYPKTSLPEVAFAGRSNVGKSSLINCLANRKKLAKTSSTPGKTRLINFFNINDMLLLVDLPGYGWARISKEEKSAWGEMVSRYLTERETLKAVVVILDVRRGISQLDTKLYEMLAHLKVPPITVLTKTDKVNQSESAKRKNELKKILGLNPSEIILFSAITGRGKKELWKAILDRTHAK